MFNQSICATATWCFKYVIKLSENFKCKSGFIFSTRSLLLDGDLVPCFVFILRSKPTIITLQAILHSHQVRQVRLKLINYRSSLSVVMQCFPMPPRPMCCQTAMRKEHLARIVLAYSSRN
jgi:hypothetical protein